MARDFLINGESMVSVKGPQGSAIASISQLGLTVSPIRVTLDVRHRDINLDAWGGEIPADTQFMLAAASISMDLVHVDRDVLSACIKLGMAGAGGVGNNEGQLARAGLRMGGGLARFASGNNYIGLNISSPVLALPYRFYFAYLTGTPVDIPLGTEKSIIVCNWRAIPYTQDPWNSGQGATGTVLYDNTLDT
jgi:hypothetical protein